MKYVTPFLHLFFIAPILIADTILMAYGYPLGNLWHPDGAYIFWLAFFGSIILFIGNFAIVTLETHIRFHPKHHLRQSILVYAALIIAYYFYSNEDFTNTPTYIYSVGIIYMSLLAIIINLISVIKVRPKKVY